MMPAAPSEAEETQRATQLIEGGAELAAASIGAAVGLIGGPPGAFGGGNGPYSFSGSSAEATAILQSHGVDGGSGIKSALCEYERCGGKWSALEAATDWADALWGPPEGGSYCTGPYGNGKTHNETQWACYGVGSGFAWQVNVDPWGEMTYHHRS